MDLPWIMGWFIRSDADHGSARMKIVTVYATGPVHILLGKKPAVMTRKVFRWNWTALVYAFLNNGPHPMPGCFIWAEVEDVRDNVVPFKRAA